MAQSRNLVLISLEIPVLSKYEWSIIGAPHFNFDHSIHPSTIYPLVVKLSMRPSFYPPTCRWGAEDVRSPAPRWQYNKHYIASLFSCSAWILSLCVPLYLKGQLAHQKSLFVPYRTQKCPLPMNLEEKWFPGTQNLPQIPLRDTIFFQNSKRFHWTRCKTSTWKYLCNHVWVDCLKS